MSDLGSIAAVVVSLLLFGYGLSESGRSNDQTLEAGSLHTVAPGDSSRILRTIEGRTYELRSIRGWCESLDPDSVLAALSPNQSDPMTPGQRAHYIRGCMWEEVRRTEPSLLVIGIPSEVQLVESGPLSRGDVAVATGVPAAMVLHKTRNMTFVEYETFARTFSVSEEMQPIAARTLQRIMKRPSTRAGLVFVASFAATIAVLDATGAISSESATKGERGARSSDEIEPFRYVLVADEAGRAHVRSSSEG